MSDGLIEDEKEILGIETTLKNIENKAKLTVTNDTINVREKRHDGRDKVEMMTRCVQHFTPIITERYNPHLYDHIHQSYTKALDALGDESDGPEIQEVLKNLDILEGITIRVNNLASIMAANSIANVKPRDFFRRRYKNQDKLIETFEEKLLGTKKKYTLKQIQEIKKKLKRESGYATYISGHPYFNKRYDDYEILVIARNIAILAYIKQYIGLIMFITGIVLIVGIIAYFIIKNKKNDNGR